MTYSVVPINLHAERGATPAVAALEHGLNADAPPKGRLVQLLEPRGADYLLAVFESPD